MESVGSPATLGDKIKFPPVRLVEILFCPLGRNRTYDHLLKRELLYRLSYEGLIIMLSIIYYFPLYQLEPLQLSYKGIFKDDFIKIALLWGKVNSFL